MDASWTLHGRSRKMARRKGFEPLTPRFEVWCSIQLSYRRRPLLYYEFGIRRLWKEDAPESLGARYGPWRIFKRYQDSTMEQKTKHDPDAGFEPAFAPPEHACDAHFHVF